MNEYQLGTLFRAFLLLLIPVVVWANVRAALAGGPYVALTCVTAIAIYGVALLPVLLRRHYDVFEPYTVLVLAILLGTVLRAPYVVLTADDEIRHHLLLSYTPDLMVGAALALLLGIAALVAGYLHGRPTQRLAREPLFLSHAWSERRMWIAVGACVAIGLLSIWLFLDEFKLDLASSDLSGKRFGKVEGGEHKTAFGYSRWGVSLIGVAFQIVVVALASRAVRLSPLKGAALLVVGALAFAFPIFTSSRSEVVMQAGVVLAAYLYVSGRVSRRAVALVPALTLAAFVILGGLRSKADTFTGVTDYLGGGPLAEETIGSRHFLDITKLALIMEHYPDRAPFLHGASYLSVLTAPIPRSSWPDKPPVGLGKTVGAEVYGLRYSGVPSTILGELWMNFGWWLIVPGMWLFGLALRLFYEWFRPVLHINAGAVLYSALLLPVTYRTSFADVSFGALAVVTTLVPTWLVLQYITVPGRIAARLRPAAP